MDEIDRIAPTQRPSAQPIMRQSWRDLLFLHWRADPDAITAQLPDGLTLDLYDGVAYVGLVPFNMRGVRPIGLPPFAPLSNFGEINVRTYVHHDGRDPGVWFFSLDAGSILAVIGARVGYHLPYFQADIVQTPPSESIVPGEPIHYRSDRLMPGRVQVQTDVTYRPVGDATCALPGALDHFLIERYVLYASNRQRLYRGRVHHKPYPVQAVTDVSLTENLIAAVGFAVTGQPVTQHYSRGVDVDIYRLELCR